MTFVAYLLSLEKYLFLELLGQVGFLSLPDPIVLIGLNLI